MRDPRVDDKRAGSLRRKRLTPVRCSKPNAIDDHTVGKGQQSNRLPSSLFSPGSAVCAASFADRSGLVEVRVARAAAGEDLRPQLHGIGRQVGVNAAAVEVGGKLHRQPGLFRGRVGLGRHRVFGGARSALQRLLEHPSLSVRHVQCKNARDGGRDIDIRRGKRVIKARFEARAVGHQGNMRIGRREAAVVAPAVDRARVADPGMTRHGHVFVGR